MYNGQAIMKMQMKKTGEPVYVYGWVPDEGRLKAVIFNYAAYHKQGQGMHLIDAKQLIPYDVDAKKRLTKSSIKSRIKMIHAEWQCSDGKVFTSSDAAMDHEKWIVALEYDLTEDEVERYMGDLNKIPKDLGQEETQNETD